jgi:glycosyltransferase involved in cell wall biosynthesis
MSAKDNQECLIADGAQEVADRILELLQNESLRIRLCENARVLLVQNFSWEGTVQKLSEVIKSSGNR